MKRVTYKELKAGVEYYEVNVGEISRIKVLSILSTDKMMVEYLYCNFPHEQYISDSGVVGCPDSYENALNALFHTKEDAEEWISTTDYKHKLEQHNAECAKLAVMLDCLERYNDGEDYEDCLERYNDGEDYF